MMRLVDQVSGAVVWIPNAWTAWTIGNLHFQRIVVGDRRTLIQWRRRGEGCWHALELETAVERARVARKNSWEPIARAS